MDETIMREIMQTLVQLMPAGTAHLCIKIDYNGQDYDLESHFENREGNRWNAMAKMGEYQTKNILNARQHEYNSIHTGDDTSDEITA
jgi:hypothetical protein